MDDGGYITADVKGGTEPYKYSWSSQPSQLGATLRGVPNGTYTVIIKDANNCEIDAQATIEYANCCKLFMPNAFTPNSDGLNDKIFIKIKGDFELKTFSIYNRYGQRVFTTANMTDGWDGKWNSKLQDLGVYYYFIEGLCGNGDKKEVMYKGDITLVR